MPLLSRQRGFTLLELLLVLAIVAVLAGMAAPALSGSLRGQRLDSQARRLISLARKARALSAAEGRTYELVFDTTENTVRLARQRDPLAAASDPEEPERELSNEDEAWSRAQPFEEGVTLGEVAEPLNLEGDVEVLDLAEPIAIRFAPDGSAQARELTLRAGTRELRLHVLPHLGRVVLVESEEESP